ncbi:MAG TPA: glucose-1-phosphate adenylyltransferase family protein [Polyangiaceae bacterium]|nr:glucose-1-phosphate adenylyltransferase family protein [Polyangiaceae bacterium]
MAKRPRVLALILAGGTGGRLEVLTEERPKPAMPFGGSYRLVDFSLSNCAHSGLSDVWVVEQYQPHSLNDHLAGGRPWDLDRTSGGLRLLPPYEGRRDGGFAEGNADALYRNRALVRAFGPDVVIVLSADHVYRLDFRDLLDEHAARGGELTLVSTRVPLEEAPRYGNVVVGEGGRVTGFDYKPKSPRGDLATAEIFAYDARALLDTLDRLGEELGDGAALRDYGHVLLPRFVERGKVYDFRLEGYWRDVGTPESYFAAHRDLLGERPAFEPDRPDWPLLTQGPQRRPAHVSASARVEDALLAPGARVRGEVARSVLGPGVEIAEGAVVRDAIVLADAVIEGGARVEGAIVDECARVGEGARVGASPPAGRVTSEALALVGRRARVAPRARVEPGARVKPGESVRGP